MTSPVPGPGWYADPADPRSLRWWDGRAWTGFTVPQEEPVRGPATAPSQLYFEEARIVPWARWAPVVYAGCAALNSALVGAYAARWRALFHWFHQVWVAASHNRQVAQAPPALPGWSNLLGLVSIAAIVVFLSWQYRAARVARQLGYPARHSPGWGVGFWFIPVVQLWLPYQALADALPPKHHARRVMLLTWVVLWLAIASAITLPISLAYGGAVGWVQLAVTLMLDGSFAYGALRFLDAVTIDHSRSV